jgi:hypothetical protein
MHNDLGWWAAPQEVGNMAKPGPKGGGEDKGAAAQEAAKNETLLYLASQGSDKAKAAIRENSKGGKSS